MSDLEFDKFIDEMKKSMDRLNKLSTILKIRFIKKIQKK